MLAKSVTVSVAVQKVRVVRRQAWSESQWTVLMGYITISTNVDAIKHITDDIFFCQEDSALVHCVCNTVQLLQRSQLIQHLSEKNVIFVFYQVVQKHKLFEVA